MERPERRRRLAAPRSTPTTRQRELADRLRELRVDKDLTVESVAASLLVSASKISRLETAVRRASPRDVRDLCLLYGVSNDERDRLMALAAQALETSWYQDAAIDAVYGTYIGLELAASDISNFQGFMVPGLLQTPEYARALLDGLRPPGQLTAENIDEMISVRVRRQEVLAGNTPPRIHAVLDAAAVHKPIGGAAVMAAQIGRLLDLGSMPTITIQIVPREAGSYPGLDGRFCVLRFADQAVRDTVYIEGLLGELFLDKDSDVARYLEIFQYLAESVALDEPESRRLLDDLRKEWLAT
jgi:transcriptional regulator with XRE-family HTH domain